MNRLEPASTDAPTPCLAISELSKTLGSVPVLKEVTLTILPGEIVGLIGPNGAGKTTLIRLIAGILQPDEGAVTICGHDLETNPLAAKAQIGFAPEPESLPDQLSGEQLLELVASAKGIADFRVGHLPEVG